MACEQNKQIQLNKTFYFGTCVLYYNINFTRPFTNTLYIQLNLCHIHVHVACHHITVS